MFGYDKPNRYTWAVLMGYLDTDPQIQKGYDFHAAPFQLYQARKHLNYFKEIPFQSYDFIVIAFSLMTIQMPQFRQFIAQAPDLFQKWHPHIITVAGGPHVMACPNEFTQYGIDFIVPNEGEVGFAQLLNQLSKYSKDEVDVSQLSGVVRASPAFILGKPAVPIELGQTPPFSERYRLFGPIEISRGCPYRCKYCQTGNRGDKMRHAPVEQVLKYIKRAAEVKFDKVWFISPNAFAYGSPGGTRPNPEALRALLSGIKEIPAIKQVFFGTFPSEVRPEFVTREALEAVVPYITNKYLVVGAQNASNNILSGIQRGHKIEDVRHAVDLLREFHLGADLDFIFGLPGETEQDIEENVKFFEEILQGAGDRYSHVKIHTHTFMPLPGTPFENAPPGQIHPKIKAIIGKLAANGMAHGEYMAQAGLVDTRYTINENKKNII